MTTIQLDGGQAQIAGGRWQSDDRELAALLQEVTDPEIIPTSTTNRDYALAQAIAKLLDGTVIRQPKPFQGS